MEMNVKALPKKMFDKRIGEEVEVVRRGCYPDSVIVRLKDGREVETEQENLE